MACSDALTFANPTPPACPVAAELEWDDIIEIQTVDSDPSGLWLDTYGNSEQDPTGTRDVELGPTRETQWTLVQPSSRRRHLADLEDAPNTEDLDPQLLLQLQRLLLGDELVARES